MLLSDKLKELREQTKQPQRKVAAVLDIVQKKYRNKRHDKFQQRINSRHPEVYRRR